MTKNSVRILALLFWLKLVGCGKMDIIMSGNVDIIFSSVINIVDRNGYVLDFSDKSFDDFTQRGVGIPLKTYYNKRSSINISKTKSLKKFFNDNEFSDFLKLKLSKRLLEYYKINIERLNESTNKLSEIQHVLDMIGEEYDCGDDISIAATELTNKINSDYINKQITKLSKEYISDPSNSLMRAKSLLESCFKYILDESDIEYDKNIEFNDLSSKAMKRLGINIKSDIDKPKEIKGMISGINQILHGVAYLRNNKSNAHGQKFNFEELGDVYSKFAVGASLNVCRFIVEVFQHDKPNEEDDFYIPF